MNLKDEAPWEWLLGFRHIHRWHGENKGGPILTSGYYLGELQSYRMELELSRREEDGSRSNIQRRGTGRSTSLSLGVPPSKTLNKVNKTSNSTS